MQALISNQFEYLFMDIEQSLTLSQAANLKNMRYHRFYFYMKKKDGGLNPKVIAGRYFFDRAEVEAWEPKCSKPGRPKRKEK